MKKAFLLSLVGSALIALSFINLPDTIVGRWQQKLPGGISVVAVFRADGTNDIFVNGKTFVTGKYYVRQDTLGYADAGCNINYYGTYKLDFFASDSLRLIALDDTCGPRRRGFNNVTLGRAKPAKP